MYTMWSHAGSTPEAECHKYQNYQNITMVMTGVIHVDTATVSQEWTSFSIRIKIDTGAGAAEQPNSVEQRYSRN